MGSRVAITLILNGVFARLRYLVVIVSLKIEALAGSDYSIRKSFLTLLPKSRLVTVCSDLIIRFDWSLAFELHRCTWVSINIV